MKYLLLSLTLFGCNGSIFKHVPQVGDCYQYSSSRNYKVTKIGNFGITLQNLKTNETEYNTFSQIERYYDLVDCDLVKND